jgi:hypothetical protein
MRATLTDDRISRHNLDYTAIAVLTELAGVSVSLWEYVPQRPDALMPLAGTGADRHILHPRSGPASTIINMVYTEGKPIGHYDFVLIDGTHLIFSLVNSC